jgi:VIT1/CCC1 family predicted Fe2+/Mn2+ transporter
MLRDTTITSGQKKRELIIILVCFLAAYLLNVIGIIQHNSPARELITQLHVVLLLAAIFYGIVIVLRILYYLISRLWVRK